MSDAPPPIDDVQHRRAWAAAHIQAAKTYGPLPRYGDPEWRQLSPTDPRRWAAVIVAAECWAIDGDDIPARMRRELDDQAAAAERIADEDFAAVAANVRRLADRPTFAELQRRRGGAPA